MYVRRSVPVCNRQALTDSFQYAIDAINRVGTNYKNLAFSNPNHSKAVPLFKRSLISSE